MTPLLTKSVNSSIERNIFPDLATALVVPLSSGKANKIEKVLKGKPNKGKPNKNDVLNFKTYNSQHVLIRLTHFMPLISFYTPENIRKPEAF